MYPVVLTLHSAMRWVVLVLLAVVIARAMRGWNRPWTTTDDRWHVALIAAADLQLALGLLLYAVLSPFPAVFLEDVRATIHDRTLRFFGLEHAAAMVVALALLHIGRVRSKRAEHRHRRVLAWTAAACVIALVTIPWPFMPTARPWLRW
jgi:hypothetical protein